MQSTYKRTMGSIVGQGVDRVMSGISSIEKQNEKLAEMRQVLQEIIGHIPQLKQSLDQISRIESKVQAQTDAIKRQQREITKLYQKQEALERASRQYEKVSEEFYTNRVLSPLLRDFLVLKNDLVSVAASKGGENGQELVEAITYQIEGAISRMGFDRIACKQGDKFNHKYMKAVKERETNNPTKHLKVAEVIRDGWAKDGWKQPVQVALYKYKTPQM